MLKSIVKELKRDLQELYNAKLKGLYLYGSYARDDADIEASAKL